MTRLETVLVFVLFLLLMSLLLSLPYVMDLITNALP